MVEDGTDLYSSFQNYFNLQKGLFEDEADAKQSEFTAYIANLEAQGDSIINELQTGYRTEMNDFKEEQENLFNTWFEFVKGQLGTDVAGNLQNEIDQLDIKTDGLISRETVFSETGDTITETYGDKSVTTEFVSDSVIVQKLYVSGVLTSTKTITFSADGSTITEVV